MRTALICIGTVVIASLLLMTPQRNTVGLSSENEAITPALLAKQMADALRQSKHLEYEVRVIEPPHEIVCSVVNEADGAVRLEVKEGGRLSYFFQVEPLPDGQWHFQENNLVGNKEADYVLPKAEFTHKLWDAKCLTGLDGCLFSGYMYSWIDPNSHRAAFFAKNIARGSYQGVRELNGRLCHVVAIKPSPDRELRPGEEIWLDTETSLPVRWRCSKRDRIITYRQRL